jgi:hypothetical protein
LKGRGFSRAKEVFLCVIPNRFGEESLSLEQVPTQAILDLSLRST